uniref:RING-type domain-containing protein n=1 Tax=Cannabis sativa TaxID=3483 RepID=A0A803RAQ3_CANSA
MDIITTSNIILTLLLVIGMLIPVCFAFVCMCMKVDHRRDDEEPPIIVVDHAKQSCIINLLCFFRKHNVRRDNLKDDECVICLEPLLEDNKVVVEMKKCKHVFHLSCINDWTRINKICPVCRLRVNTVYIVTCTDVSTKSDRDTVENMV